MSTGKRVLVIGGTRYFGYNIARTLLADDHQVTIFSRGRSQLFPEGAEHIQGDRTRHDQFKQTFKGREYDVVIDMIAYREPDSVAAIEAFSGSAAHFIHISTASVYSVLKRMPSPAREEHFAGELKRPGKASRGFQYGMGKRKCEEALWRAHAESGFPVTTLRLPIVLGEGDYTLRAQSYLLRIMDGEPLILPDGGMNPMSFVHQSDVVDFVTDHLGDEALIGEAFNLAQDEICTPRTFVELAAAFMNREPALVDIPISILQRVGFEFTASPFTSKRPFIVSNEKVKQVAGFEPTPVEAWLERMVRHFSVEGPSQVPAEYDNREYELEIIDAWQKACETFASNLAPREQAETEEAVE